MRRKRGRKGIIKMHLREVGCGVWSSLQAPLSEKSAVFCVVAVVSSLYVCVDVSYFNAEFVLNKPLVCRFEF
jgi:hypothetical protein